MKKNLVDCELCSDKGFAKEKLIEHYRRKHSVSSTSPLLLNYLTSLVKANRPNVERCLVCETITAGSRAKARHMLQFHNSLYSEQIDSIPVKVEIDIVPEIHKTVYTLSIFKTSNFYDYDWSSAAVVNGFLKSSKLIVDSLRVKEISPSKKISVSVSFTIVNKDTRSTITRYLPVRGWSTTVIKTISLNETVMESLQSQIKSRIIQNGESGSHAVFSHFKSFKMLVSNVKDGDVTAIFGGNDELKVKTLRLNAYCWDL